MDVQHHLHVSGGTFRGFLLSLVPENTHLSNEVKPKHLNVPLMKQSTNVAAIRQFYCCSFELLP